MTAAAARLRSNGPPHLLACSILPPDPGSSKPFKLVRDKCILPRPAKPIKCRNGYRAVKGRRCVRVARGQGQY